MFYSKRQIIYTILIIIALTISFFAGKQMSVNNQPVAQEKEVQEVQDNVNYNTSLNVKGTGYDFTYTVKRAFFVDRETMNLDFEPVKNDKIQSLKVVTKDQDNNILEIKPLPSQDGKILSYTVKLNNNTKKVNIIVYPLTKEMSDNTSLDLNTVPFQTTKLDVELTKKLQIESLQ